MRELHPPSNQSRAPRLLGGLGGGAWDREPDLHLARAQPD